MPIMCVRFCSCLCKVCSHVSEAVLLALQTLFLLTLPQTVSLRSQGPQHQYTVHCMHFGITLLAYISEPLIKDSQKRLSLTKKPHYRMLKSLDHTLPLRMCYGRYMETLQVKKMADLVAVT